MSTPAMDNISGKPVVHQLNLSTSVEAEPSLTVEEVPASLPADVLADQARVAETLLEDEEEWPEPDPIPVEPVKLADGELVQLRQPEEFTALHIKPAMRGMQAMGLPGFIDGIAARAIKSWNLRDRHGRPIKGPAVNPSAMDEITPQQWNQIARYLAVYYEHFDPPKNRARPTTA